MESKSKSIELEKSLRTASRLALLTVALCYLLISGARAEQATVKSKAIEPQEVKHYAPWKHPKILYDKNHLPSRTDPSGLPAYTRPGYGKSQFGHTKSYGPSNIQEGSSQNVYRQLLPKLQPSRRAPLVQEVIQPPEPAASPAKPLEINARVGNIGPYRKGLLQRISQALAAQKCCRAGQDLILVLTISQPGEVLKLVIEPPSEHLSRRERSGINECAREIQEILEDTEFEPLPDWFRGESLTFRINYGKVNPAIGQSSTKSASTQQPIAEDSKTPMALRKALKPLVVTYPEPAYAALNLESFWDNPQSHADEWSMLMQKGSELAQESPQLAIPFYKALQSRCVAQGYSPYKLFLVQQALINEYDKTTEYAAQLSVVNDQKQLVSKLFGDQSFQMGQLYWDEIYDIKMQLVPSRKDGKKQRQPLTNTAKLTKQAKSLCPMGKINFGTTADPAFPSTRRTIYQLLAKHLSNDTISENSDKVLFLNIDKEGKLLSAYVLNNSKLTPAKTKDNTLLRSIPKQFPVLPDNFLALSCKLFVPIKSLQEPERLLAPQAAGNPNQLSANISPEDLVSLNKYRRQITKLIGESVSKKLGEKQCVINLSLNRAGKCVYASVSHAKDKDGDPKQLPSPDVLNEDKEITSIVRELVFPSLPMCVKPNILRVRASVAGGVQTN